MSSPQVAVYLLVSDVTSPRTGKVMSLFSNPLFSLGVANVSPPDDLAVPSNLTRNDAISNYRVRWCLYDASQNHPDSYVLVVKDTSTSEASSDRIADIVTAAISSGNWDVCYLSNWLDRCDLYSEKKPINGTSTTLVKTSSPHGLQAVIFSPAGRDMVLGNQPLRDGSTFPDNQKIHSALHNAVLNGQLHATTVRPNLISYDPLAATKPTDYLKTQECVVPPGNGSSSAGTTTQIATTANNDNSLAQTPSSSNNWIWWILLIIVILILLYLWYRWNQKRHVMI